MSKLMFRHFIGAYLNKKNIAVYGDADNNRILVLEESGNEKARITITAEEYRDLRDEWSEGGKLQEEDAIITDRALDWFYSMSDMETRGAPLGNQNARKDDDEKASSTLVVRVKPSELKPCFRETH